jgi:hypothetical protein
MATAVWVRLWGSIPIVITMLPFVPGMDTASNLKFRNEHACIELCRVRARSAGRL